MADDGKWWNRGITQGFKWSPALPVAHSGVDFGMPVGTSLASPQTGQVRDEAFMPWGGQVDVVTNDPRSGTVTESYLHLSQIAVHRGDPVQPGTLIGQSGDPPPPYGNGPHLHFEETSGASSPYIDYSPHLPTFNTHPIDPTPLVNAWRKNDPTQGDSWQQNVGSSGNPLDVAGAILNLSSTIAHIPEAVASTFKDAITLPFRGLGIDSLSDFLWRTGLVFIGTILVLYALFKLFEPAAKTAVNVGIAAAKVAPK